ncbi:MAG: CocE/NonD family hydrolase [Candidatus Thermoplasmatota archaeon]|nr:CocE/NonD family hydrolase [Candidatus Thermoplasmatota archaeon]MEE3082793.1 CocE/NonD family hydrolase [Candidatus Thermoplasmatota archaeon]
MSDTILEAEVIEDIPADERREGRQLNLAMGATVAIVILFMILAATFGVGLSKNVSEGNLNDGHWLPPVEERSKMQYDNTDVFSRVSVNGSYNVSSVQSVFVDVPTITLADGGAGATGGAVVHLGLWVPEIPGCDFTQQNLSAECQIPVIAEIGPYYGDGDVDALTPADRLGRFLIENFVPHGYGVAQVSVFGTGESNHCMDLMGHDEQAGIKAAVDWLGSQSWSNGKVGAIGKSYDGSTPWNAAASGTEYLATIVPMSGLIGVHELMWRNGSMEARGAIMHNGVYGSFGLDGDGGDAETACEGYMEGYYAGVGAYLSGDNLAWTGSDYWEERYFLDRAMDLYNGSIYIIHGMQDWNVDPHMAFPAHQISIDNGFDVKGLYGQWTHDYPDRASGHQGGIGFPWSLRWDWADDLLEWFDYYLRDMGPKPRLVAEIQDDLGGWRVESTYPPEDLQWIDIGLDSCDLISGGAFITSTSQTQLDCGTFENDTRIVGSPTLHVEAQISLTATGGHLFAEMVRASDGQHLGHAVMDLRFHAGGKNGEVLNPGETVIAKMEFFAMDVFVPAGDGIIIVITQTGDDYVPSPVSVQPVTVSLDGNSILSLSTVERTCDDLFLPPMMFGGEVLISPDGIYDCEWESM